MMMLPSLLPLLMLLLILLLLDSWKCQAWSSTTTFLTRSHRLGLYAATSSPTWNLLVNNEEEEEEDDDDHYDYIPTFDFDNDINSDSAQTIFPYLCDWQLQPDGSLRGIVSHHDRFEHGSCIATSQVVQRDLDSLLLLSVSSFETLVTTITGSQYLLGPPLLVGISEWSLTDDGCLTGTVTEDYFQCDLQQGQVITTPTLHHDHYHDLVPGAVLFTNTNHLDSDLEYYGTTCSRFRLDGPPKSREDADTTISVIPMLHSWKRLDGGALAGFVSHHAKIPDGELITTSPLVELDESGLDGIVLVTTATGSQYRLGEPEPIKPSYSSPEPVHEFSMVMDYDYQDEWDTNAKDLVNINNNNHWQYQQEDGQEEDSTVITTNSDLKKMPLQHVLDAATKAIRQHQNHHQQPQLASFFFLSQHPNTNHHPSMMVYGNHNHTQAALGHS